MHKKADDIQKANVQLLKACAKEALKRHKVCYAGRCVKALIKYYASRLNIA